MTREEAKNAAEIMMAYAEGKEIEICDSRKEWKISQCPAFNWGECHYRIKQEPSYRPFKDKDECWNEMLKHQPFGWVKNSDRIMNIFNIDNVGIIYICDGELDNLDYKGSLNYMKFTDGTPFGIKEE